ncbi:MAG TPA: hypothetical protein VD860_06080 [Azospirillum sp.]|nr:hypothetical protein [Azospirillum sp.]
MNWGMVHSRTSSGSGAGNGVAERRSSPFRLLLLAGVALGLAACNTTARKLSAEEQLKQDQEVAQLTAGKPSALSHLYRNVVVDGRKDAVLNWMYVGKSALDMGRLDLAGEAFDKALAGIETIYADNPDAEKARSVWNKEAVKDFKGEPYERAMAYYYRGLVYLMTGDLDNARASFKGSMLQDSFAENERHRADFAIAAFMEGWTNRCSGTAVQSSAQEKFQEAQTARGTLLPPDPTDRMLFLIEAGTGPSKAATGQFKEKLVFQEQQGPKNGYRVRVGQQEQAARLAEDLFFQATTRGGREMDKILAVKAGTKLATATAGATAVGVGVGIMAVSQYTSNQNDQRAALAAGAAVALVGLLAQAAAKSMHPEADTRYWWQLPHSVYVATLPATRIGSLDDIAVLHENGAPALIKRDPIRVASVGGCTLVWVPTSVVQIEAPKELPPDTKKPDEPEKKDAKRPPKPAARTTREAKGKDAVPFGGCRTNSGAVLNLDAEACNAISGTVLALAAAPAKG